MLSPNTDKSLYEVFSNWIINFSRTLNCIKIGEIVSFNKERQTVNVQVLHKFIYENNLFKKQLIDYPILCEVPVVVMGGGTSYITHPISVGDQCVLLFNDYELDNWQNTGKVSLTNTKRTHNISDAIAIVGLRALPNALQAYSDYLNLHYSDISSIIIGETIEVNNQTINLNGNTNVAGDEVVTGSVSAPTLNATLAASGSFVSADNKTVTVVNGIITAIE